VRGVWAHQYAQREDEKKTQRRDGILHTKERGLRGNNPASTLILDFQPSEL
jgi:hypothetical protein